MRAILLIFVLILGCASDDVHRMRNADAMEPDPEKIVVPDRKTDGGITLEVPDAAPVETFEDAGWDYDAEVDSGPDWREPDGAIDAAWDAGTDAAIAEVRTCDPCVDVEDCPLGHKCLWYEPDAEGRCLPDRLYEGQSNCYEAFEGMAPIDFNAGMDKVCVPNFNQSCEAWQLSFL